MSRFHLLATFLRYINPNGEKQKRKTKLLLLPYFSLIMTFGTTFGEVYCFS